MILFGLLGLLKHTGRAVHHYQTWINREEYQNFFIQMKDPCKKTFWFLYLFLFICLLAYLLCQGSSPSLIYTRLITPESHSSKNFLNPSFLKSPTMDFYFHWETVACAHSRGKDSPRCKQTYRRRLEVAFHIGCEFIDILPKQGERETRALDVWTSCVRISFRIRYPRKVRFLIYLAKEHGVKAKRKRVKSSWSGLVQICRHSGRVNI